MKASIILSIAAAVTANVQQTKPYNGKPSTKPSSTYSNNKPAAGYGAVAPADRQYCELVKGINNYRARNGLPALTGDTRLDKAAKRQCNEMANAQLLEHEINSKLGDRLESAGYDWKGCAENIYSEQRGYKERGQEAGQNFQRALDGWINSPGHERNIVGDYTAIGHAYCVDSNGQGYWAQEFGAGGDDTENQYSCDEPTNEVVAESEEKPTYEAEEPTEEYTKKPINEVVAESAEKPTYEAEAPAYKPKVAAVKPAKAYEPKVAAVKPIGGYVPKQDYEPKENDIKPVKFGKHGKPCKSTSYGKKSKSGKNPKQTAEAEEAEETEETEEAV